MTRSILIFGFLFILSFANVPGQSNEEYRFRYRVVGEGEAWTYTADPAVYPRGLSSRNAELEVQALTGPGGHSESVFIRVEPSPHWLFITFILIGGFLVLLWFLKIEQDRQRLTHDKENHARNSQHRQKEADSQKALQEVKRLREISAVLSEISTKFINLPVEEIDEEVEVALKKVGEATGVQRASISFFEEDRKFVTLKHQWSAEGVKSVPEFLLHFDISKFPYTYHRILEGKPAFFSDQDKDFPVEAVEELEVAKQMDWKSMAVIPMTVEGETIGHLGLSTIDRTYSWSASLLDDFSVAGQVFANAFARRDRIMAMYSLREDALAAAERERTRVSREIHDQLGGALSGLRILARALENETKKKDSTKGLAANAGRIVEIIDDTITDVRRICAELRPAILDNLSLEAALEWQAVDFHRNTGIPCRFDLQFTEPPAPNPSRDVALYRITQELLTNVTRHAEAKSVCISLGRDKEAGLIILTVEDDGKGIDFNGVKEKRQHFGLRGIEERAELLNGKVTFSNLDPGTKIEVIVPDFGVEE